MTKKSSDLRQPHRKPPGWRRSDLPDYCTATLRVDQADIDRFKARVTVDPITDCWTMKSRAKWTRAAIDGVQHPLPYAVWRLFRNGLPPKFIEPRCETAGCLNPQHLHGADHLCAKGLHILSPENLKPYSDGRMLCLECHLERWSKCRNGHDLDETGRRTPTGWRVCKVCQDEKAARYWAENRERIVVRKRQARADRTPEQKEADRTRRREREQAKRESMTLPERAARARQKAAWKRAKAARLRAQQVSAATPQQGERADGRTA